MTLQRLGKYEIRGVLGRGAHGLVYDGFDPVLQRRVAIKTMLVPSGDDQEAQDSLKWFRRGAAAGGLSHPNIVAIYTFEETGDTAFIAMEYVGGGSLQDLLNKRQALPRARICDIMRQVLAALEHSHAAGVVHRDVKPANVLLTVDGVAKLADFGISRRIDSSTTMVGTVLGTPAYMSPEQARGEPADARSDIYAAGATFFHLLTGKRPYEGSGEAVMMMVLAAKAPPLASDRLPGLPAAYDAVLSRAMACRPADRFVSALAFAEAIEAAVREDRGAVGEIPRHPPRSAPVPGPKREPARSMVLLGAAALAFLLVAGAGAYWQFSPGQPPAPPPPPPPPPPPKVDAQAVASAVAQAIADVPCTLLLRARADGDIIELSGFAQRGDAVAELRDRAERLAKGLHVGAGEVTSFDGPYCAALDAIRPAARHGTVSITLPGANSGLPEGAHLLVDIGGIDFPAYVRVDWINTDGDVKHIYPEVATKAGKTPDGQKRLGLPADPSALLPAGETLNLGTGLGTHRIQLVDKPPGTDMIIVTACAEKLLDDRPHNVEKAGVARAYLATLLAAVMDAERRGVSLGAGAVLVKTLPKQ